MSKEKRKSAAPAQSTTGDAILIGQAKLQRQLNVSPMTFWRWQRDKKLAFPAKLKINNRIYFRLSDVQAWIDRQQQQGRVTA